jgi:hypothetical protein
MKPTKVFNKEDAILFNRAQYVIQAISKKYGFKKATVVIEPHNKFDLKKFDVKGQTAH